MVAPGEHQDEAAVSDDELMAVLNHGVMMEPSTA